MSMIKNQDVKLLKLDKILKLLNTIVLNIVFYYLISLETKQIKNIIMDISHIIIFYKNNYNN